MFLKLRIWGRYASSALVTAAVACGLDQASKLWLLFGYGLADRGPVHILPFVDLVSTWNTGISYGLFQHEGSMAQWILSSVRVSAVTILWLWVARSCVRLTACALGLIIGGAIGNGIDGVVYGAVVDFVLLHVTSTSFRFEWYVFNLADAAIAVGVAMLLYEWLIGVCARRAT